MGAGARIFVLSGAIAALRQRVAHQDVLSLNTIWLAIGLFWIQTLLYASWRVYIYPRFFSPLRHFPMPPGGNPLMGHTYDVLHNATGSVQQRWIDSVPNSGIIRYRMWFTDRLFVTSPKALSEVLVQRNYDFIKPPQLRSGLIRLLGEGILLAEGEEHKRQRKDLMPSFSFRHVKDLYPLFWSKGREMVSVLAEASKAAPSAAEATERHEAGLDPVAHPGAIELGDYVSRTTLDIIGEAGMGTNFDSLRNPDNKLNNMYRTIFSAGSGRFVLQVLAAFLPSWILGNLPMKRNNDISAASKYIKEVCRDLIAKTREEMAEKGRARKDIISVALESKYFTDEQLVNQCMTFLVAGHETTATAMNWAMFFLCRHPDVQKKLQEEIRANIPSISSDVTAADLDKCSYLHAVCLEVLRLRSPVTLTLRVAACDTQIGGNPIPKGTLVILVPSAVNTSVQQWGEDAKEFKPERWLDADGKANNQGSAESNYSFMTFLHGPRSCIGQRFAQAEFACLLAAWVGRFETSFEEGSPLKSGEPEVTSGVTAKPKGGLWVNLKEVDGW